MTALINPALPQAKNPIWYDTSRWQGIIDFDKWIQYAIHGITATGWIGRASISWGYKDSFFNRGQTEAKRVGAYNGAYHIFYPEEDPKRQADNFFSSIGDAGADLYILDVELAHNTSPNQFADNMQSILEIMDSETGKPTLTYGTANFLDHYVFGDMGSPAWFRSRYLMMAQWLKSGVEHPGPYKVPEGCSFDNVALVQTSQDQDGAALGYQSVQADISRQQWTNSQMLDRIINAGQIIDPPDPEQPVCLDYALKVDLEHANKRLDVIDRNFSKLYTGLQDIIDDSEF